MNIIDHLFQTVILIIALTYKYLLIKRNLWGWILAGVVSIITFFYLYIFYRLPIVMSIELCFLSITFYGIYKHKSKIEVLTKIDYSIIFFTLVAIIFFVFKQLQVQTTIFEIGASVVFLSGIVLMAQKKYIMQILAWMFFFSGSVFMGIVYYIDPLQRKWELVILHIASLFIAMYAINTIVKGNKKNRSKKY
jgi:hypothetical protein